MTRLMTEVLWLAIKYRVDWLVALIYRRYCPGRGPSLLARDCVRSGNCGCDNYDRYAPGGRE